MHPSSAKPARITCPRCGGKNPEIARFCNHCGLDFAASDPPPTVASPPTPGPQAPRPTQPVPPSPAPATASSAPPPTPTQPPQANPQGRGRKICPGCHTFNAATSSFCADCGVALPREASTPTFGGPAGFWIRLVASILDGVLLVLIDMVLSDRLGLPDPDPERMEFTRYLVEVMPAMLVSLAVYSVYSMIMVGTWGGTVGKLILGLRVVRFSDGGRVPYGLALGRSLAELVSLLFVGLGYIWIALTPSKRGWHDYLCDTRVVRARPE